MIMATLKENKLKNQANAERWKNEFTQGREQYKNFFKYIEKMFDDENGKFIMLYGIPLSTSACFKSLSDILFYLNKILKHPVSISTLKHTHHWVGYFKQFERLPETKLERENFLKNNC